MSRWLPAELAPKDGRELLMCSAVGKPYIAFYRNGDWEDTRGGLREPVYYQPIDVPPSGTDDIDAQLSPESLADVQAGRQVCRAIYTGLAEVASLESLKPKE